MLNCEKWLPKTEIDTFKKCLIRAFNLKGKKVYISEDQASRLYGQLIQTTNQKHELNHLIQRYSTKNKSNLQVRDNIKFSYVTSDVVSVNRIT